VEQLSIFGYAGQTKGLPKQFLDYYPNIFSEAESNFLLHKLISETEWNHRTVKMYDKQVATPRLMKWYGDTNNKLTTRTDIGLLPWTKELLMIRSKIQTISDLQCNAVLLNYYHDGNDSVAWHSDKESVPGRKTVVGSVSFGEVRSFDIRNKSDHNERYSIRLENGSFLLMKAGFQDEWEHRIAKSTKPMKARLNLTFRLIG
jgi:alkylated DNA repair dioxygenase AlkB